MNDVTPLWRWSSPSGTSLILNNNDNNNNADDDVDDERFKKKKKKHAMKVFVFHINC